MPRASEPRVVVRFSDADLAVVEAAAVAAGVALGGLVRECAVRYAAAVAREVVEGRLVLRRRAGGGFMTAGYDVGSDSVAANIPVSIPEVVGVDRAVAFRLATQGR